VEEPLLQQRCGNEALGLRLPGVSGVEFTAFGIAVSFSKNGTTTKALVEG